MKRIIFFGNNRVGTEVFDFLNEHPRTNVVGLVMHPAAIRKFAPRTSVNVRIWEVGTPCEDEIRVG